MTFARNGQCSLTAPLPCPKVKGTYSDRSKDGDLCYKQMDWIDTWMNDPRHKAALGVNPELDFQSCNMEVNQAFAMQGDGAHNSAALLPDLVNDGIRLLVYAGNAGTSFQQTTYDFF